MAFLRPFCYVFPPKPAAFGHISEDSFDHKYIKIIDINRVRRFSVKPLNVLKNSWNNEHLRQLSD